jgi:hypothetical protein
MTTIEQIVEIPADHRLMIEVPPEIPEGKAILAFTPAGEEKKTPHDRGTAGKKLPGAGNTRGATPHTDWLCGLLSHVGDISLEELRNERLSKYLK